MPQSRQQTALEGASVSDFLRVLQDPGRNLRDHYKGKPLELAERLGLLLPRKPVHKMIEQGVITEEEAILRFGKPHPGIREMVEEVCLLQIRDAAAVASRGGGKSYSVSFIEFYLWLLLDFDALNLGGSELQADNVYQYLIGYLDSDPYWKTLLKTDPQREKTFSIEDSWVRVLTASSKSVRSPHAGGKRRGKIRGGLLVIDEEAEADKEIVEAALPTINTAMPSVNVRCSTFHNVSGSFADLVDNYEIMGYRLYRWDTFDVCAGCECFSGDTRFITDEGIKTLREMEGQKCRVLGAKGKTGHAGKWTEATIKRFGTRQLWEVVLNNQGHVKTVLATENHRWFARSGRYERTPHVEKTTTNLQPGDRLRSAYSVLTHETEVSPWGVAHGFTFGDGTRAKDSRKAKKGRSEAEWKVVSVRKTRKTEEVFCAVVPDGQAFTLEDNILVGNCVDKCQSPEPCFREDHIELVTNPDTGEPEEKLLHRAYSFAGQEVVVVRTPLGEVFCTTLKELYEIFGDGKASVRVPKGWYLLDGTTFHGRNGSSVAWTRLKRVSRHRPEVSLRNIQLGTGDSLTVTDDHPFLIRQGCSDVFVPASEVQVGDTGVPVDVVGLLGSESFVLDPNLAYLVGAYLAEGNCGINAVGSKWVIFSGLSDASYLEGIAKKAGVGYRVRPHSKRGWNLHFGAEFYDLLVKLGIGEETALDKKMPVNILDWDQASTAALLCGLLDGDGTVKQGTPSAFLNGAGCGDVTIRVASKALVTQAHMCLRKLGMSGWISYLGFWKNAKYVQNYPLYGIEFSISESKREFFQMSEKILDSFSWRTRGYGKINKARSRTVRKVKEVILGQKYVYDVTTSSETFVCSGIKTHNCGGRARFAEGWVPMEEIEALWRRMRRNHARWEVEAMGQRPSSGGMVMLDMQKFNDSIVNVPAASLYQLNNPVDIDVDWGTGAGAIEVWQEQGKKQVLLHAEQLLENNRTQMFGAIISYSIKYRSDLVAVNCDIGGGGNYLNQELRDEHRLPVNDVNFSEVKETAAAAWNIYNDAGNLVIPAEHEEFIHQTRNWRRVNGRINKGNDHLCDAAVCHFASFIDRLGLTKVSIPPRSFRSNPDLAGGPQRQVSAKQRAMAGTQSRGRVAIARGFGSKRKK